LPRRPAREPSDADLDSAVACDSLVIVEDANDLEPAPRTLRTALLKGFSARIANADVNARQRIE